MDILKKFVDIYLNEDGGKINKILNDCKSLIFLVITLFLIDSFLSADTVSLNLIFDNKNFANKSIEIFSFDIPQSHIDSGYSVVLDRTVSPVSILMH